jgi:membrane protein required for beta-lactamase induction
MTSPLIHTTEYLFISSMKVYLASLFFLVYCFFKIFMVSFLFLTYQIEAQRHVKCLILGFVLCDCRSTLSWFVSVQSFTVHVFGLINSN